MPGCLTLTPTTQADTIYLPWRDGWPSWPWWLVITQGWFTSPQTVTHPGSNHLIATWQWVKPRTSRFDVLTITPPSQLLVYSTSGSSSYKPTICSVPWKNSGSSVMSAEYYFTGTCLAHWDHFSRLARDSGVVFCNLWSLVVLTNSEAEMSMSSRLACTVNTEDNIEQLGLGVHRMDPCPGMAWQATKIMITHQCFGVIVFSRNGVYSLKLQEVEKLYL